jgi:hypothetical protein
VSWKDPGLDPLGLPSRRHVLHEEEVAKPRLLGAYKASVVGAVEVK